MFQPKKESQSNQLLSADMEAEDRLGIVLLGKLSKTIPFQNWVAASR